MKRPLMKAALAAASVTVIAGSLAGCSTSPAEQNLFCSRDATKKEIPGDVHAIVLASNVANAPAWALTDQIKAALTEILEAGGRVDVVSTAGDGYLCPAERLGLETFTESTNEVAKEDIVRRNRNDILKAIAAAPRTDGSDAYAALHLAADQFESIGGRQRVLLFWSSGLNDHGALDYTTGLLGSEPDEVVSYLANRVRCRRWTVSLRSRRAWAGRPRPRSRWTTASEGTSKTPTRRSCRPREPHQPWTRPRSAPTRSTPWARRL